MISRAENLLHVSLPVARRPWSRSSNNGSTDIELESASRKSATIEDDFRAALRICFIPKDSNDELSFRCWSWYSHYLDASIKRDWSTILAPVISGLDPEFPKQAHLQTQQLAHIYKVVQVIVHAIRERGDVSIDGIIDELNTKQLLRTEMSTVDQNPNRQLVWCLAGTTTMLYDPSCSAHTSKLWLREPPSTLRSGRARRLRDLAGTQQEISSCRDPLHSLLGQFGDLIPQVELSTAALSSLGQDQINIAYINYYTLKNVAKLDIEWVNTMNLHLQLDKRKRILRLYRYPVFCRLLWSDTEDCFMDKLYDDHRRSQFQIVGDDNMDHSFSEYLREIILSYRLLFGIDKKSRDAFKPEYANWHRSIDHTNAPESRASTRFTNPVNPRQPSNPPTTAHRLEEDPLLTILTTTDAAHTSHSTENQTTLARLLADLHGEEKSTIYDFTDFPFLASRLAALQRFSLVQKPNDWMSLFWVDRRDTQNFWNSLIACALLLIGGWTVFLQFLQLVFQIWGTVIAHLQWRAGG